MVSPQSRLWELLRPERGDIMSLVVFAFFTGVLYLATPLAVDAVVNNIAFGGQQKVYTQALLILSFALLVFLGFLAIVRVAQHVVMELVQRRLVVRIAADMAYRFPRLKYGKVVSGYQPDLVNRFFDILTVEKSSSMLLLEGLNLVLGTLVGLVVLGFYHPFLLAFDLLLIGLILVLAFGFGRGAVRSKIAESYNKHVLAGWLEQLGFFPLLFKSAGGAEFGCRKTDELSQQYLESRQSHFKILLRQVAGFLALQALANAALLAIGGRLVLEGELTLGQLVASELIVSAIVASLASMGKHLEAFYDAMGAMDKLGYIVDLPVEREGGDTSDQEGTGAMDVELVNLGFSYDSSRPVLEDMSVKIPKGSRVAVTGRMGAGKSTMLDLLFGLRDPQGGQVLVGGVDVRDWDLPKLRERISLIRDHDLVDGTLLENVILGREGIPTSRVQDVLKSLRLTEVVSRLDGGLRTRLKMGGYPLSYSERIRLILARAMAQSPSVLLLDRFLEDWDGDNREAINDFLFDPVQPWTLFIATRDHSIIDRCDLVIQLDRDGSSRIINAKEFLNESK